MIPISCHLHFRAIATYDTYALFLIRHVHLSLAQSLVDLGLLLTFNIPHFRAPPHCQPLRSIESTPRNVRRASW